MAPFQIERLRTYKSNKSTSYPKSADVFNALLALNKSEAEKKKRLAVKELPPRTPKVTYSTEESLHVSTEDTFDKLAKGPIFNDVVKKDKVMYCSSESELSKSSSFKLPEISINFSPISTRTRGKCKRKYKPNKERKKAPEHQGALARTLDKPVDTELSIERVPVDKGVREYCALSYINLPDIREDEARVEITLEYPSLNNHLIKSPLVRNKEKISSTPNIVSSTPFVQPAPKLFTADESVESPIKNSLQSFNESMVLMQQSLEEIRSWSIAKPSIDSFIVHKSASATRDDDNRCTLGPQQTPKSRKFKQIDYGRDYKLYVNPRVYIRPHLQLEEELRKYSTNKTQSKNSSSYACSQMLRNHYSARINSNGSFKKRRTLRDFRCKGECISRSIRDKPLKITLPKNLTEITNNDDTSEGNLNSVQNVDLEKFESFFEVHHTDIMLDENKKLVVELEDIGDEINDLNTSDLSNRYVTKRRKWKLGNKVKSSASRSNAGKEHSLVNLIPVISVENISESKLQKLSDSSQRKKLVKDAKIIIEPLPDTIVKEYLTSSNVSTEVDSDDSSQYSIDLISSSNSDEVNLESSSKIDKDCAVDLTKNDFYNNHDLYFHSAEVIDLTDDSNEDFLGVITDNSKSVPGERNGFTKDLFESFEITSNNDQSKKSLNDEVNTNSAKHNETSIIETRGAKRRRITKSPAHKSNNSTFGNLTDDNLVIANRTNSTKLRESTVETDVKQISQIINLSDIIESSIDERSKNGEIFTRPQPLTRRNEFKKSIAVKPGKAWRRSLYIARNSILANNFSRITPSIDSSYDSRDRTIHPSRLSIRIVPATPERRTRKASILEKYARNSARYDVSTRQDIEFIRRVEPEEERHKEFEESLRKLSINDRKTGLQQQQIHQVQRNTSLVPFITAKDLVLRKCGQTEPLDFSECYPPSILQNCQKIGEGVYAEVFLYRNQNGGTTVMKIIPIEGNLIVNGERQKTFSEILSEIIISMELSNLRNAKKNYTTGFVEVKKIRCLKGCYPDRLLELWELYNDNKGSENDSPEVFPEDQLYIVIELDNGGKDLEAFTFSSAAQSYALFKQIACALAVAENHLHFEHRDLHWGNILIAPVYGRHKEMTFRIDGKEITVDSEGIALSIIDYTLSRVEVDGVVVYNDLSLDPDLFSAEGDYQFEIYKLMQKRNGNEWKHFEPYTNILWLHYIIDKAINGLRYKNIRSVIHKDHINKFIKLKEEILSFSSASEFVSNKFL